MPRSSKISLDAYSVIIEHYYNIIKRKRKAITYICLTMIKACHLQYIVPCTKEQYAQCSQNSDECELKNKTVRHDTCIALPKKSYEDVLPYFLHIGLNSRKITNDLLCPDGKLIYTKNEFSPLEDIYAEDQKKQWISRLLIIGLVTGKGIQQSQVLKKMVDFFCEKYDDSQESKQFVEEFENAYSRQVFSCFHTPLGYYLSNSVDDLTEYDGLNKNSLYQVIYMQIKRHPLTKLRKSKHAIDDLELAITHS